MPHQNLVILALLSTSEKLQCRSKMQKSPVAAAVNVTVVVVIIHFVLRNPAASRRTSFQPRSKKVKFNLNQFRCLISLLISLSGLPRFSRLPALATDPSPDRAGLPAQRGEEGK